MKKYLLLLLSAPLFSQAQDCAIRKERDPYTKEVKVSTGFIQIGQGKVNIEANAKEIDVFFALGSGLCFDDQSTLAVNFAGSRIKTNYRSGGTMNCEGFYHFIVRNTPETHYSLKKMIDNAVNTFTFTSGKVVTTLTLTDEQREALQKGMACLTTEAKTLIPPPVQ